MKENRAVPTDKDLNVVWPTETEASRITEQKDVPEEESTQSGEEIVVEYFPAAVWKAL